MADGRTTAMREIRVGDLVYGTTRADTHRKFAITTVLDKWSSLEMAHDVRLEDETRLIASGRHRFLRVVGGATLAMPEAESLSVPILISKAGSLASGASLILQAWTLITGRATCAVWSAETVACFGTGEPATTAGHTSRTASAWL